MATKKELYDRAGELGITERDKMNKASLEKAVAELEGKDNPVHEPTPNQKHEVQLKTPEELVDDAASDDPREALAAKRELESRSQKFVAEKTKRSTSGGVEKSAPAKYIVEKGCLVNTNGMLTELAVGSIVSALTHNLETLRDHGAELKEISASELTTDQFGALVTKAIK